MDNKKEIYSKISRVFQAWLNCVESGSSLWEENHESTIKEIVKNYLPYGAGFDSGTEFDFDNSKPEKLIFKTSFHHMDENGFYEGWTDHLIKITPSLGYGFNIKVTGPNKNEIKDYIYEVFS